MNTGQKIKRIRLDLGMSMTDFAKAIDPNGKAQSGTVANWETGKNLPNKKRLSKIANIGDVSVDYLLSNNEKIYQISEDELYFILKSLATMVRQGMLTDEEFGMYLDIENKFKNEVKNE